MDEGATVRWTEARPPHDGQPLPPSRGRAGLELRPERRPGSVSTLEARQGAPGSPGLDLEVAPRVGADLGDDHRGDVRARSRRCARGLTWRLVARASSVVPDDRRRAWSFSSPLVS